MGDRSWIEGDGGNPVATLKCIEVEVGIVDEVGERAYKIPVLASTRKEKPNYIIGANFQAAYDCDLLLQ